METKQKLPWFEEFYTQIFRYKDIEFSDGYCYDYRQQIVLDIKDYCDDNAFRILPLLASGYTQEEIEELLYNSCIDEDCVTGNSSGSYWFSQWYADNALCHNWDLVVDAFFDLGDVTEVNLLDIYPEKIDVLIRCHLLLECIHEYVTEIILCYVEN